MQNAFIDTLHDPLVRDLAWVIGAPVLLDASHPEYRGRVVDDAWCGAQLQACAPWLAALDRSPLVLHDFIAARPTRRLGHYFEALITFWLMHLPGAQLIAANLQVHEGQRTVGEYDFLFRHSDTGVCHWEAAVKFYLQVVPSAELRAFIGPGARDRLDLKLDRVFRHQLQLGHTRAGQAALPSGAQLDQAQAFIKGYLFYHVSTAARIATDGISAAHPSGWWLRHKEEKLPQASADSRWIIQPRLRWLAPARLEGDAGVMTAATLDATLEAHFNTSADALLVIELVREGNCGWRETARGFVVCGTWPVVDGGPAA